MGSITRTLGSFLLFLGLVGCIPSQTYGKAYSTYGKYVEEIINSFAKEMQKEGFRCTEDGGGMPYDVRTLRIGFIVYGKGSIESGREKVIFLTEKFLEAINNHEGVRPYLREYPFPESRVNVSLTFYSPENEYYQDGSVSNIYHTRNKIFYWSYDGENKRVDHLEESYSAALALVNRMNVNNRPPAHVAQKGETTVIPSRKRLGTLVTDLSGFTPGRELEALGVSLGEKDLAEDIGELIGGICNEHFDEAFLERLTQAVNKNSTGEFLEYWDNGQIKAKVPYKNGHGEGHVHAWYQNGESAFKAYYKEGKRMGIQLAFYPGGIPNGTDLLGRVLEYDMQGRLSGKQTTCIQNLLAYVFYDQGILDGDTIFYNGKGNGVCFGHWKYKKGKVVKVKVPPKKVDGLSEGVL